MRYIIGSLIISFMILFILVLMLIAMGIEAPENMGQYLGAAWLVLAVIILPFSKKIIRAD